MNMYSIFNVDDRVAKLCECVLAELVPRFKEIDEIA